MPSSPEVRRARYVPKPGPKRFEGHTHTVESKAKMGEASRKWWSEVASGEWRLAHAERTSKRFAGVPKGFHNYSSARRGRREDLGGYFFRSAWEANYARYLNVLVSRGVIQHWEFEPITFWFETIKRGTRSYLPDFMVVLPDDSIEFHEVKGWLDKRSKTKLARMAKYHPEIVVRLVGEHEYKRIEREEAGSILEWEYKTRSSNKGMAAQEAG